MYEFIVIGMPRTGSTLVQTTLEQHPEILMLGELFHWVDTEREGGHAIDGVEGKVFFRPHHDDPVSFLSGAVWSQENARYGAVGFKLFGEYLEADSTASLFEDIKTAVPNLRVIYLWRRDLLAVLVSRAMALKTGEWVRRVGEEAPTDQGQLSISIPEVESFFETHQQKKAFLDKWSQDLPRLQLDYEDLSHQFGNAAAKMFEFLAVAPMSVRPSIQKQLDRSPREILQNWDELESHFRKTQYAHLFGC